MRCFHLLHYMGIEDLIASCFLPQTGDICALMSCPCCLTGGWWQALRKGAGLWGKLGVQRRLFFVDWKWMSQRKKCGKKQKSGLP